MNSIKILLVLSLLFLTACSNTQYKNLPIEKPSRYGNMKSYNVLGKKYYVKETSEGYQEVGYASWYGKKFQGKLTSSRENFDMYKVSGASKTLPIPTYVEVENLSNGKKILVRINDRGPFHSNRIIDLSYAAAKKLDMISKGVQRVKVTSIKPYQQRK